MSDSSRKRRKLSQKSKEENKDAQITALKQKLVDAKKQLKLNNIEKERAITGLERKIVDTECKLIEINIENKWAISVLEQKFLNTERILRQSNEEKKRVAELEEKLADTKWKLRQSVLQGEEKDKYIEKLKEHLEEAQEQLKRVDKTVRINSLPHEILVKIFGYLTQNDLGKVAQVSKRFREYARCPLLWTKVDVRFLSCGFLNQVATNFCESLPTSVTYLNIFLCHKENVQWKNSLNFENFCAVLQKKCPHLRVLILRKAKIWDSFQSMLDICAESLKKLKVLIFHECEFGTAFRSTFSYSVSKIEVLDVSLCIDIGCVYSTHLFSKLPCLKKLNFTFTAGDVDTWIKVATPFLTKLETLNLAGTFVCPYYFHRLLQHLPNLTELYLCTNHFNDDYLLLLDFCPKLKTLCCKGCINVTLKSLISVIQTHNSLMNVYIQKEMVELYGRDPFVIMNPPKLEIVKDTFECYHFSNVDDYFHEYKDD